MFIKFFRKFIFRIILLIISTRRTVAFFKLKNHKSAKFLINFPTIIHLGDIIWFEPLVRLFTSAGYRVSIECPKAIEFYFSSLGYDVNTNFPKKKTTFNVTRLELLTTPLIFTKTLFLNFDFKKLKEPLINSVLRDVARLMSIDFKTISTKPSKLKFSDLNYINLEAKFNLNKESKFIIFNNYIDSHRWNMSKNELEDDIKILINKLNMIKKSTDCKVIHCGTLMDKNLDYREYPSVDHDLRGLTTLAETFILASMNNVEAYVGFDTFWMHLFNIYEKKQYIKLRPGFNEDYNGIIRKYVAVPYTSGLNAVRNIEFI